MNPVATEICRMSWFLIEMDEALTKGFVQPSGKSVYCIIHSVDLIDGDHANMYLNRVVKFNRNHAIVQGKVLLASDDRLFVERQLKQLAQNAEDAVLQNENDKRFLVQYNKGANNIIHAIVHQKEICWPMGDLANQREVLIRDGKIQRLATVLYAHEQEERVQAELQKLKTRCFDAAFDEKDHETEIDGNPWLLVQYSCSPTNVVYAIINFRETVWQEENLYKDVVAYLTDGSSVFQSIIVRKSHNRNELDFELRNLKESSLTSQFPLVLDIEPMISYTKPGNGVVPVDHQSLCAKSLQLDRSELDADTMTSCQILEQMELQMQTEASMIADAFEAIDVIRRTMEQRLFILSNP